MPTHLCQLLLEMHQCTPVLVSRLLRLAQLPTQLLSNLQDA